MKAKLLKFIFFTVQLLFLLIVVLTVLSLFGVPKDLQIFVIETGSMEPVIKTGSLAFISPATTYQVGDIITFKSRVTKDSTKNYMVTHRIYSIRNEDGDIYYTTKGDANKEVDPLETNGLNVVGKTKFTVPYIGYVIGFAKTKLGFFLLLVIPSILIIYSEIFNIWKEFNKQKKHKYSRFTNNLGHEIAYPIR